MKDVRLGLLLVVLAALALCGTGYGQKATNKAGIGGWASNGRVAIRVDKVEQVRSWDGLGKFIRVGKSEREALAGLKKVFDAQECRIFLVHMQMRNDSTAMRPLGWHICDDERGYVYLRGEEGSIKRSTATWDSRSTVNVTQAGTLLTRYLAGGLAENASVAPKAVVKGKVAFVVEEWYVPVKLFTKPSSDAYWFGTTDLIVSLK